jgi:hypothetical protein
MMPLLLALAVLVCEQLSVSLKLASTQPVYQSSSPPDHTQSLPKEVSTPRWEST